jgi:hypothetical protein
MAAFFMRPVPCAGDVNQDGVWRLLALDAIAAHFGAMRNLCVGAHSYGGGVPKRRKLAKSVLIPQR